MPRFGDTFIIIRKWLVILICLAPSHQSQVNCTKIKIRAKLCFEGMTQFNLPVKLANNFIDQEFIIGDHLVAQKYVPEAGDAVLQS